MNILKIGTIDKSGGAAFISWSIKNFMEKLGHKVSMYVSLKYSDDQNVYQIKRILPRYYRYICLLLSNDIDMFGTNWILKTKIFKEADIIHFHNIHGWFFNLKTLQKISKIKPTIWTLHDEWAITPHCACSLGGNLKDGFYQCKSTNLYPKILWHNEKYLMWRKKMLYKNTNIDLVVPSVWLKDKVEKSVLGNKRIHLIYNGIDTNLFKPVNKIETRKELGLSEDKKIVLFVVDGETKNPYKGWVYVENILKKYSNDDNIRFICIGSTSIKEENFNSNATYVQRIDDPKLLAKYYSSADVFLYPSLADTFGLVVAESMSCGTPVVTFQTGGIPEIVDHKKNGYVAKYGNQKDLECGLTYLLSRSENECKLISEYSIEKVKNNFTVEIMGNNYLKLYEEILKRKN